MIEWELGYCNTGICIYLWIGNDEYGIYVSECTIGKLIQGWKEKVEKCRPVFVDYQ
jgi:hypothetical protein